ncbi:SHOCT domain-containing protein [Megasphaera sp. UBA4382]
MLSDGVVSEEEYHRFETIYSEKYKPVLGTLFSSMALTSTQ